MSSPPERSGERGPCGILRAKIWDLAAPSDDIAFSCFVLEGLCAGSAPPQKAKGASRFWNAPSIRGTLDRRFERLLPRLAVGRDGGCDFHLFVLEGLRIRWR